MAEALVDPLVGGLVEVVLHKVAQEANVVISFKNDFQWLSKKLKFLKGFLRDAGGQSRHNDLVNDWLHEIEDVAYDAEDIFEECLLAESDADTSHCFCSYPQFLFRYRMGRRIKDVKDRIKSILEDATELKLFHDVSHQDQTDDYTRISAQTYRKKSSLLSNESQTVGMEEKIEMMISWLNEPETRVIAVVGMGGLGKTFLLQHVFKREKECFSNSIWLSISQHYSVKELQCDIGQKIGLSNLKDLSEEAAAESIHGRLQGQSSLIVLDDVWREDRLVERIGLPVERSCKIVISSRMKEVCTKMGARVYDMELLSEENSWKLFCFHAFPDCEQNPPQELEEVARAIEKKCGRLPLAVKTIAASMASTKRLPNEWKLKFRWLDEVDISNDVTPILRSSYDALPSHLKSCFVYCSAFPEDSEIDVEILINLWIAEGFICRGSREEHSDVAMSYVNELIDRCLVELSDKESLFSFGTEKYLKMHDLLRDLCRSISDKENKCFFESGKGLQEFPNSELCRGRRRISLRENCVRVLPETNECPGLRTLLLSGNKEIAKLPASFISNLKSLRVLDLRCTTIKSLPEAVGNLKLLRVLDVSGTAIEQLPESVRGLRSLQVLDVSDCRSLKRLPEGIGELKYLRHLTVDGCSLDFIPRGVSKLSYLEKFVEVELKEENGLRLEDFKGLTQLRHLKIFIKNELDIEMTWILGGLVKMRTLFLWNSSNCDVAHLSEKMASLKELEMLYLSYFALPNWLCGFQNLVQLDLYECDCENYPPLETLPNLRFLTIGSNESCREFPKEFGKAGGFPKLERLHLSALCLEELPKLEDGAMPRLKSFSLFDCKMLTKMPDGMERLTTLEELTVENCEGWKDMKEGREDWKKLKDHLPHVKILWSSDADYNSSDSPSE
eukprot:Gb_25815 [translate_table: standard]